MQEQSLIDLLKSLNINFLRFDHPAVYTCEEAQMYLKNAPGAGTKNLFLQAEKSQRYFLLTVHEDKRVDINTLARHIGAGKLRFASAGDMLTYLGIEPGSVTLLAIVNDDRHQVEVLIDRDLWDSLGLQCHPLTNKATLVLAPPDIKRFLDHTGHPFQLMDIPIKL